MEKKLEARTANSFDGLVAGGRRGLNRQSSQFNILPKEPEDGVMIDPSMLATTHAGRKASIVKPSSKPGASSKRQSSVVSLGSGSGIISGSGGGGGGNSSSHVKESNNIPTGAHVPAAFYREIEEQLADALFKRTQAKLMADPDQANVESALADGLKVTFVLFTLRTPGNSLV